jgi:hypothetical protein
MISTNSIGSPGPTLTIDKLLEAQRRIAALGPAPPEIRESVHAVQRLQSRVYPKRKAKNESHLRRMNNKWKRRYGFVCKPAAYLMDTSKFDKVWGFPGKRILLVHPDLMAVARCALSRSAGTP